MTTDWRVGQAVEMAGEVGEVVAVVHGVVQVRWASGVVSGQPHGTGLIYRGGKVSPALAAVPAYRRTSALYQRTRPRSPRRTADQRAADRIDGYDRDDLGESPDY